MIRYIPLLAMLIVSLAWVPSAHAAKNKDVQVYLNDKPIAFDVPPIQVNGRLLVPVRAIMEELGAEVHYDQRTRDIGITFGDLVISMKVDHREAAINSFELILEVPPILLDGRVMVPLRFIGETLGYQILWNAEDQIATLQSYDETYNWLYRIYLRQFGAPFEILYSDHYSYFNDYPTFSEPFSFSGQMNLELTDENQFSKTHGKRSGRYQDGTFTYTTAATLNNSNEVSQVQREFVQYIGSTWDAYLNQGAGWSRYQTKNFDELNDLSGSLQHLLSFFLLNYDDVEVQSQRAGVPSKLVFTLPSSEYTGISAAPLNRILETYLTTDTNFPFNFNMFASAALIVDAENLRIERTDVTFNLDGQQLSGNYDAHFDYNYEDVEPIEDIVISNTGLEVLNEAVVHMLQMNYSYSGELQPGPIQIEGSWSKDLQSYIKVSYQNEVYQELYSNNQTDTRKSRFFNRDPWEDETGPDESYYYSGNNLKILEYLKKHTSIPDVTTRIDDGREKKILRFQLETSEWEDVSDLVHIFRNDFGIGLSWDASVKVQFEFQIDVEESFAESMTNTLTLFDDEQPKTYIHKYVYHADPFVKMPAIGQS